MKIRIKRIIIVFIISSCLFATKQSCAQYYPAGLPKSKINLWLDATDASTITIASGTISKWTDKVNGLQAISPGSSNNPVINSSLLSNKNLIEFQGTKVLNIADNTLLDPTNGFNLAQIVYVHPDASTSYTSATDFRVGTYSRNENPNGINNGTASITVKYVTADAKYRLSLQRNTSSVVLGNGNASFPDLSGTWNLFENYLTWTGPADTAIVVQQNANAQISSPFTWYNSAQSVGIGNRYTNNASVHWSIGETILTGVPLRKAGKNILDIYLAYKWGLQNNLPVSLQNLYNSPASDFNNNIIGIGNEGGVDSVAGNGSNNGMGFQNVTGINGFLREAGDYLLAGDNGSSGTTTIGTGFTRWSRVWFVDKTDTIGYGGNLNLFFDFTTYGIGNSLDTTNNSYYLLYNPTNSSFSSGTNYLIPVSSYQQIASTKQLSFLVDALNLNNGYYTIVYATKGTPASNIPLLNNFVAPSINISPAPYISASYAGNTFNYLSINTDSIQYAIAYLKIFAGTNGATPVLIDSIAGNSKFYAHYNLNNANSYTYYVKAGYAAGKESKASNTVVLTPGVYAAVWQTQPQYAGTGKVYMKAKEPVTGAPVKYYFQAVSGGGHSYGYTATSNYTDSLLSNGNSYTYQFRTIDSVKGAGTESAWSAPITIFLADSAKGGFAYKFAFADNSSYIIPNGIGPTNYIATTIDTTGLRFIRHAPAPYVHPRIYCNPEDSTDIKWRLKNTASGRAVAKYIHAFTTLLQLGYSPGSYSTSANYAKDTLGNPILSNVGYYNEKPRYDSLSAGDIGVVQNIANGFSGYADKLANVLAYEAFECWLFKGQIDSTTMTSYTTRANKLAKAVAFWAKKALTVNNPTVSFANRDTYGSLQIAFIYDFLYDQMTTTQRDTVRMFIAALQPTDSSQLHLYNTPSYATVSNWATFGWEIWNMLAIEGETGYTQTDDNTLQNYCRTVLNFLNYGFYSQTGAPVEGIGKNQLNVPMLVALAKRGYSMLGHPAVRAFATKYYPAVMQPFGYSMLGTDLLGGTGKLNDFVNNTYISAAYGGWKHAVSLDPIGLKWIYPNDTTVDFVWKNYMQKNCAGGPTYNFNYRYQDFLGDAQGHAGYWNFLHAAIFASDYSSTPLLTQAQKVYSNNLTYFDSLGGFATLRSGYDTLSSALFFHCRTDLGGHTYGNKNDIVYSALGRIWIPRVFTNANTNAPLASGTSVASAILINGVGQSVDTTTAQNLNILPVPGKILNFYNKPKIQSIAGDATDAYSYQWSYLFGGYTGDNPLLGGSYTKVLKTLNNYRYAKYYNFDDIPLYNKYTQGDYSWNAGPYYYRTVSSPWLNGTIKKAFRTVALVTDNKPYVLVADDVQKDNTVNNYKWVAQIANDLTVDSIVVSNTSSGFRNDIILKEPSATGNRRLLVRVLNNNGAVSASIPAYIDSITNPISSVSPNNKLPRLVVESNSIDPQYKVMLFAYNYGDPLPLTFWNTDKSKLVIKNNGVNKTITFTLDSAGRTNISLMDGIAYYNTANSDIATAGNWGINTDGTGLNPLNFTDTVQTFHIKNSGAYLSTGLTVSGANTLFKIDSGYNLTIRPGGSLVSGASSVIDFQGQSVILQSTQSGTGSIGQITGTLSNGTNITVQQYIAGGNRGYRFFGHPYSSGISLNQLTNVIDITGGLGNASLGFTPTVTNNPSSFWFNPANGDNNATFDGGWTAFTDLTQTSGLNGWNAYKGILLYIRGIKGEGLTGNSYTPSAVTLSTTGAVNTGTQSIGLSNAATGWNLISNPYPSSVNLTAPLSSAGLSGAYVWNPWGGVGGVYVAIPVSSNYVIPSSSAFFVHTVTGQSMIFNESDKTTGSSATTVFGIKPGIQIDVLSGNNFYDRYYLFGDGMSKNELDKNDLMKLNNRSMNIYSKTLDGSKVSIDSRPIEKIFELPLYVESDESRDYTFSIVNMVSMGEDMYLHDKKLGVYELLESGKRYDFRVDINDSSTMVNRFSITSVKEKAISTSIDNTNGIKLQVSDMGNAWRVNYSLDKPAQVKLRLMGLSGVLLQQAVLGASVQGAYTISKGNLSEGVYIIELQSSDNKKSFKIIK